jgi:hypothetical protein
MADANAIDWGPDGPTLPQFGRRPRLFQITSGSNPYAAFEVWLNEADGATADNGEWPATVANKSLWEVAGRTDIAAGTIVEATPNPFGEGFYFSSPSAVFIPHPLGMPCIVETRDAYGVLTAITLKQVWVIDALGTTECRTSVACTSSACPVAYYCVDGVITTVAAGSAVPAGTVVSGPWATLVEAEHGCPLADVTLAGCCATDVTLPGEVWVNIGDVTGWLVGQLPNSVRVVIDPGTLTGYADLTFATPLGACTYFRATISAACDAGLDRWGVNVQISADIDCSCVSDPGTGSAPWTIYGGGSGGVGFSQKFACSNSWPLAAPEACGTASLTCTAGAATFKVTVSR